MAKKTHTNSHTEQGAVTKKKKKNSSARNILDSPNPETECNSKKPIFVKQTHIHQKEAKYTVENPS